MLRDEEEPLPQELDGVTVSVPAVKPEEKLSVTFSPLPLIDTPVPL